MSRRLLLGYLSLVLLVLLVLELPLGIAYARNERSNLESKVEHDAVSFASLAEDALSLHTPVAPVRAQAVAYTRRTGGRVVIVNRSGIRIVDTQPTFSGESDFATRPEILTALAGDVAVGTRYSKTLRRSLLYVAVPVASGGEVHGAVRLTYPTSTVDARVHRTWLMLGLVGAIVLAATALVGIRLAAWVARPLAEVEEAAARVGEGELDARAPEEGPPEVRSLARSFNETAAKLKALLRSQEAFVADASHQLRTPLTALRLRLENLEAGGADVAGALAEVERLARLVDDLLALARAAASGAGASAVNVGDAIAGRVEAWSPLAAERGVALVHGAGAPRARAARSRLDQVLDNLLSNALDAAPAGSAIELSAELVDGWVELHVTDHGPGLPPDDRVRAFDRFWRGRAGPGSGLGLAIVRRLVAADAGEVELQETAGGGVDAVIRLRPA
ncbi:MAG: ATP-binding protein [Gaiellaceae bacterium]